MSIDLTSIDARFSKAAEALKLQESEVPLLIKVLSTVGIEKDDSGLKYLNSSLVSLDDLVEILQSNYVDKGKFNIKAAASYLKGADPFDTSTIQVTKLDAPVTPNPTVDALVQIIQASKPVGQMTDPELLALWDKDRSEHSENELNRRAKGQPFIILKSGTNVPGKEEIDVEYTLEMLKSARKRNNPKIVPYRDNTFASVYKISELNLNDRIIEICPICGEVLWRGYCEKCNSNFAGIGNDERAYVRLIAESGKFQTSSVSDRKAVLTSAAKGIEDLKITWPSIFKRFEELKLTGDLPKLRMIANRPAQVPVDIQDPFHVSGKRQY